jgi:MurNAc alpha-1-phosphate uridylyltransferase
MNAMILAAGRGERMRPLTDTTPKPLLEVAGKPLIVHHLNKLASIGIDRVVINISWLADRIRDALGDGHQFGLHIDYSFEPEALETAGGIVQALGLLDDSFIVINGDVFTHFDFTNLKTPEQQAHLVLIDNPGHNSNGDFAIEHGFLSNREEQRLTFSGIAVYRKSFFESVNVGKVALAPLFKAGADRGVISAEHFPGLWSDVGTPERMRALYKAIQVDLCQVGNPPARISNT